MPFDTRPSSMKMRIDIGMLDALGVGMYENIGQSLVEFVANGHDANASRVEIKMPFELIARERKLARDQAKVDLSRFSAAPSARLSHLSFEGDRAFPAQC